MAKCSIELEIPLSKLFGTDNIKLENYYDTVKVKLYKCIEEALINEIETNGLYDTFSDAIDQATEDEDNEDVVDQFLESIKDKVIDDIKHHNIEIISCNVDPYDCFWVTFDYNFTRLWKKFKEE